MTKAEFFFWDFFLAFSEVYSSRRVKWAIVGLIRKGGSFRKKISLIQKETRLHIFYRIFVIKIILEYTEENQSFDALDPLGLDMKKWNDRIRTELKKHPNLIHYESENWSHNLPRKTENFVRKERKKHRVWIFIFSEWKTE